MIGGAEPLELVRRACGGTGAANRRGGWLVRRGWALHLCSRRFERGVHLFDGGVDDRAGLSQGHVVIDLIEAPLELSVRVGHLIRECLVEVLKRRSGVV